MKTCTYNCNALTVKELHDCATRVHGAADQPPPTRKERTSRVHELLRGAYDAPRKEFRFMIGDKQVCESCFITAYGIGRLGKQPSSYRRIKRVILADDLLDASRGRVDRRSPKRDYAVSWWRQYCENYCDQLPAATKYIVPYDDWRAVYLEYTAMTPASLCCGYSFFNKVRRSVFPNVHRLKAKGSMSRCGICVRAADMLQKRHWTTDQRDLIMTYRAKHIAAMQLERTVLAEHRAEAHADPKYGVIMFDAMDQSKGNIPMAPKPRTPKNLESMDRMGAKSDFPVHFVIMLTRH